MPKYPALLSSDEAEAIGRIAYRQWRAVQAGTRDRDIAWDILDRHIPGKVADVRRVNRKIAKRDHQRLEALNTGPVFTRCQPLPGKWIPDPTAPYGK